MAKRLKVIVVDDDPLVLATTQASLEAMGHQVLVRESALGTAPLVVREHPDVVLVDVEMPGITGDGLATVIRGQNNDVAVILYSGIQPKELDRLVKKTGALGGIHKTEDLSAFATRFQKLVVQI